MTTKCVGYMDGLTICVLASLLCGSNKMAYDVSRGAYSMQAQEGQLFAPQLTFDLKDHSKFKLLSTEVSK